MNIKLHKVKYKKLIFSCPFSSFYYFSAILPDRLVDPLADPLEPQYDLRSFDSQDFNNLKENTDYIDPDDESSLAEVEKEILMLAEIEANRFNDDEDEVDTPTTKTYSSQSSSSAKATIPSDATKVTEISDEEDNEEVVLSQVSRIEYVKFEEKDSPSKFHVEKDSVASTSKTAKKLSAPRKRKAEDDKTPEVAGPSETRIKKKKVSLEVPVTPPRRAVRQTRASKRKTVGDSPVPEKKSKRKTSD